MWWNGGNRNVPVRHNIVGILTEAAVECTEEAIVNALCMAEDMDGVDGHTAPALPLEAVKEIMARYPRPPRQEAPSKPPEPSQP